MLDFGYYNMDCMQGMKEFPDNYFDLAIVDPPYGININMNMGLKKGQVKKHTKKDWDKSIPDNSYFKELFRVSKNQIIWGGITTTFHHATTLLCGIRAKVCTDEVLVSASLHGLLSREVQGFLN